jgi:hypothetical protein
MAKHVDIPDIAGALEAREFPTVTVWNRLEGRPRTADYSRSLRAEVRDPLWMLSHQWQLGEFEADDAGSPITAKLQVAASRLTSYQPGSSPPVPFSEQLPLEATVERRRAMLGLDLRLLLGRRWLAVIAGIGTYADEFIAQYPIELPDPEDPADAAICAHPDAWAAVAAVAGRALDGGALYTYLAAAATHHASDNVQIDQGDRDAVDEAGDRFVAWFEDLVLQPVGDDAWQQPRLEYRFACTAPVGAAETMLVADAFGGGRLDWHSVDADAPAGAAPPAQGVGGETVVRHALMPTPVAFAGMPNARYWAFEDGRTNFGDVSASTTDLATLLLCEFALVYGNDWFLLPCDLPVGSLARVTGLSVTTVFGEQFWIERTGVRPEDDWQSFALFTLDRVGSDSVVDPGLPLLPTAPLTQEGDPLEEVALIRDEMANMVWGVERVVPLVDGVGVRGAEAAVETRAFYERHVAPVTPPPPAAPIRYEAMTSVPENWIPFVPVHVDGDNREIQLQRGAVPRLLEGDPNPPVPVRPLTSLLREGLDHMPPEPYFVHEEEVPRAGVRVRQEFRRTRWRNGRVVVWYAAHRGVGRGEGSSGLAFDRLADSSSA